VSGRAGAVEAYTLTNDLLVVLLILTCLLALAVIGRVMIKGDLSWSDVLILLVAVFLSPVQVIRIICKRRSKP
jgi:hypothetical protein